MGPHSHAEASHSFVFSLFPQCTCCQKHAFHTFLKGRERHQITLRKNFSYTERCTKAVRRISLPVNMLTARVNDQAGFVEGSSCCQTSHNILNNLNSNKHPWHFQLRHFNSLFFLTLSRFSRATLSEPENRGHQGDTEQNTDPEQSPCQAEENAHRIPDPEQDTDTQVCG